MCVCVLLSFKVFMCSVVTLNSQQLAELTLTSTFEENNCFSVRYEFLQVIWNCDICFEHAGVKTAEPEKRK